VEGADLQRIEQKLAAISDGDVRALRTICGGSGAADVSRREREDAPHIAAISCAAGSGEKAVSDQYSYDPACEDLAEHFLRDGIVDGRSVLTEENKKELAQAIQDAVENWIAGRW
jgi:hypothetical protein